MKKTSDIVLASKISDWLKEYLKKSGLKCFVVGVSGGIDSALVSTLCARTGMPTTVISISISSHPKNTQSSLDHCDWLKENFPNVQVLYTDLTESFKALEGDLLQLASTEDTRGLALANAKSRLRMITMYHIATVNSGIVVGTGNKVEDFGIGFFTKYGDGGVDISPIADLTKTQVRSLAASLGVLSKIVEAKPTDGLWEDNRTDEDQIGASYEELEWAMDWIGKTQTYEKFILEENELTKNLSQRQLQVLRIFIGLNQKNKHKMLPIPVFVENNILNFKN